MEYVIIGNSIAGINAIEGIREYDWGSTVTIISGENYYAYSRPLITYWLEGRIGNRNSTTGLRSFTRRKTYAFSRGSGL